MTRSHAEIYAVHHPSNTGSLPGWAAVKRMYAAPDGISQNRRPHNILLEAQILQAIRYPHVGYVIFQS